MRNGVEAHYSLPTIFSDNRSFFDKLSSLTENEQDEVV